MDFSTLPYEVQFKYLLNLAYDDIISYCQTSKAASQICRSDWFWRDKILMDFGPEILGYKSDEISHFDQYKRLINPNLTDAIFDTDLPVLDLLYHQGERFNVNAVNQLAEQGSIRGLDWFKSKGIYPDREGLWRASENEESDVLKWYLLNNLESTDVVAANALRQGLFDVLDWLSQEGYVPKSMQIEDIEQYPLESLGWLYAHGYRPSQDDILHVIEENNSVILNSFISHGFVTEAEIQRIINES